MRLKDKVAIITGSAGGMGQAAAELFASEGASVVVTDVVSDAGEETARKIRDAGGKAIFVTANVAKEEDVKNMVGAAIDAFGHVDVLYNNAGIMPSDDGSHKVHRTAHDQPGQRFNYQCGVICRLHGLHRATGCLHCLQGRYDRTDQIFRGSIRPPWYTLQRHLSRTY